MSRGTTSPTRRTDWPSNKAPPNNPLQQAGTGSWLSRFNDFPAALAAELGVRRWLVAEFDTMKRQGDFSEPTIEVLAKRVAYLCSRASCRRRTVGPHSNEVKVTLVGEAAHLCAASPGGPRYDRSMSDEERRSHENGIWLCANCATEIDKDPARFPVSLLRWWKEDAEYEALSSLENPSYRNHQQHKEQLAAFLTEAQQLRSRLNEDPLPIRDHNSWVDQVSQYLKDCFGNAHEVRFSDFSGMTFYVDGSSERSKLSVSLDGRSRRLNEFMSELGV